MCGGVNLDWVVTGQRIGRRKSLLQEEQVFPKKWWKDGSGDRHVCLLLGV